jgi:hypothetical protein
VKKAFQKVKEKESPQEAEDLNNDILKVIMMARKSRKRRRKKSFWDWF